MSRDERLREAVSAIFSDPEEAAAEFDKNVKDLTPRDAIHEIDIPMGPRFFWLDARQSFILGQYVGSVLLAGMSIEIAVRQFLERFFERRVSDREVKSIISSLLEELDFRKIVKLCQDRKCFGDDTVYAKLHECYNIRTKYSHAKISAILGTWGSEPVAVSNEHGETMRTDRLGEDELLTAVVVSKINARDDALKIIRLVEQSLEVVFCRSGYSSGELGKK
jgi:hypothetical protein